MLRELLLSLLFTATLGLIVPPAHAQQQTHNSSHASPIGILLVKPRDPVYPAIARIARIQGDVKVIIHVRKDGTVDSVNYLSGPPLLKKAAMDSANASKFECDGCTEAITPYPLTYTFQFLYIDSCNPSSADVETSESQHHIWVTAPVQDICDPGDVLPAKVPGKVRSIKCLYLWKCARRTPRVEATY